MALATPPGLRLSASERRYVPRPGQIDIDRVLAKDRGLQVGSRLRVLGRELAVVRIHSGGYLAERLNSRAPRA